MTKTNVLNLAVKIPNSLKTRLKLEATRQNCLTNELVAEALDVYLPKFEGILIEESVDRNGAETLREQFEKAVSS